MPKCCHHTQLKACFLRITFPSDSSGKLARIWEGGRAGTTVNLLGFLAVFVIAAVAGLAGEGLAQGEMPFSWAFAILVGIMGSITGTALLGGWGPALAGVYLLPAALGASVFTFLFELTLGALSPKAATR